MEDLTKYDLKVLFKTGYWMLKNFLFGFEFPMAISVDVTNKCNLRCKHCYFFQQDNKKELSETDLINKLKQIKKKFPSIMHASWVGGEPLLRKRVVEEGTKIFPINMVITNGSIELPKLRNCVFYVSVDGTKKYFEKIRGKNVYDKIKKNADRDDVIVYIACVLNKQNYDCIEDMLEEWKKTKVKGIVFDFYTPIKGIEENLWLNWKEKDKVIEKLIKLKKKYGSFIYNSTSLLKSMKSEKSSEITMKCVVPDAVICLNPMGKRKLPCVIGNKADCLRCGCVIPFFMDSLIKNHIKKHKNSRKIPNSF